MDKLQQMGTDNGYQLVHLVWSVYQKAYCFSQLL